MTVFSSLPESDPLSVDVLPESPTVSIITLDTKGLVRTPPRPSEALLTRPLDECTGHSIENVLPNPMGGQLLERVGDAVAQRQPVAVDLYHPSAKRWLAVHIQPEPDVVTVTLRDRTYRKQCETLLHLLDATVLEGLWRTAPDGTIQTANATIARFLGVGDSGTLEGKNVRQFIADVPDNPEWSSLHNAAVEQETVDDVSCTFERRDGRRTVGRLHLTAVRDRAGRVTALDGSVIADDATAGIHPRRGLLERAVDAAEDAIMITEARPLDFPGPEIVFVNSAFTSLTGYSEEATVGQTPQVLYGPATDRDVLDTLQARLINEQPFRSETVLYRQDGTPYVSEWSVAPVRDEMGTVSHWMVVQRDVTEQRSAEAALRKREDPTEALYTSLDPLLESTTPTEVATATTTLVTTVLNSSRAVVRHRAGDTLTVLATANGTTAESVRLDGNHSAAQAFHSHGLIVDDARLHFPLGDHGVLSLEDASSEETLLIRPLEVLASHATTVLDRIAEAAAQRRAHERCEALRAASRALLSDAVGPREIEKAFDALVPLLPPDVCLRLFSFGPDNDMARVRAANDHPADLGRGTAWPMDAGLGRFRSAEALYMIDDLGDGPATALEERLLRAGCRSYVVAPVGEAGSIQGVLLLAAEQPGAFTTAQRTLIEDIADLMGAALDRLKPKPPQPSGVATDDSSALKSAFLANMHHELRTPLTSIIGFAEVLSAKEESDRFADLIARSGERLKNTFDALLTLSRLEAETITLNPSPLSVPADVRAVVESFEEAAREADLSVNWEGPDASFDALVDHDGLRDVLHHLLDNAIKFTEAGGTVTVRLDATDDTIVLAVADTGIGMDPDCVSELFAPFRQASTGLNRSYEGCGLGLAIVQGWTDAMGGTVNVETAPGQGTTVSVRLPRGPVDS